MKNIFFFQTDIGKIAVADNGSAVTHVLFEGEMLPCGAKIRRTDIIAEAGIQLLEYLAGKRKIFDLPLEPAGTDFQKKVWQALLEIPFGETRSYGEIAKIIGNPNAARAVGMANGKNPIPVFIPCHRVIGSGGKLTGYSGGLGLKEYLLNLESAALNKYL